MITEYFQTGIPMRKILDIHRRVHHQMHKAQLHRDDLVPFEVPML